MMNARVDGQSLTLKLIILLVTALSITVAVVSSASKTNAQEDASGLFVFGSRASTENAGGSNPLIFWSELEPQQGVYNWGPLDSLLNSGDRVIPRIYTNVGGHGQGTPDWFFALPGAQSYSPYGNYKAPVSWDPVFKQEFGRFLSALGARYNGHPAIEFFQTNAAGGVYGELYLGANPPGGYASQMHIDTAIYWIDRWLEAFPSTNLSVQVNFIGNSIGETVSANAASKGVYLQMNSPWLEAGAVAMLSQNAGSTKIVLEVEDAGCQSATGAAFDEMIATIFGYGFPIDYLTLCGQSFSDPATAAKLPAVVAGLRSSPLAEQPQAQAVEQFQPQPEPAQVVEQPEAVEQPQTQNEVQQPSNLPTAGKSIGSEGDADDLFKFVLAPVLLLFLVMGFWKIKKESRKQI